MGEELRDFVEIESPEAVDVEVEVAGLGSRLLAAFLDTLIQALLLIAMVAVSAVLGLRVPAIPIRFLEYLHINLAIIVYALGFFLIYWGYYVLFEVLRNGQTPGKEAVDIRVVREGGRPITFFASAVRNLLRPIEAWTPVTLLTVSLMAFTRRHKRIGDWAAGTIVMKERARTIPVAAPAPSEYRAGVSTGPPLTGIELAALGENQISLISNLLTRRGELDVQARQRLALEMAHSAAEKMGRELPDLSLAACEGFLEEIVRASRSRP